jgi:hypothetical protein
MVLGSQAACPGPLTPGAPQRQNKISVIHSIVVVLAIFVAVAIAIAVCLSRYPVIVPLVFHRGLPVLVAFPLSCSTVAFLLSRYCPVGVPP